MTDSSEAKTASWTLAAAGVLVALAIAPMASAQDKPQISIGPAQTRDLKDAAPVPSVPRPAGLVTNRPTIPMADYIAAKNAAAAPRASRQTKPTPQAQPSTSGVTLFAQTAVNNESQTTGGNRFPPDADVATSAVWAVQVVNDLITMYNWFTNASQQLTLATFFGDATNYLFAPRVIWDRYWDRFIVLSDGCSPCSGATTNSVLKLAVSKTGDPTAAWWTYNFYSTNTGDFLDFPQLGMDFDALIMTINYFPASGLPDALVLTVAKPYAYNGFTPIVSVGSAGDATGSFGFGCTLAPPYNVVDDNADSYLLSFCPGDNKVYFFSVTNSGRSNWSFKLNNTVAVPNSGIPPNAQQPGVTYALDTGDNRFENRSLQSFNRIINTATINRGGFPAPAYYNFNISPSFPPSLVSSGSFFVSANSYDWHPAINANEVAIPEGGGLGEVFATWMYTDPSNGVNLSLRASGGIGDAPALSGGVNVFTSAQPLTNQTDSNGVHRTGDYGYIALYPAVALGCLAGEVGVLTGETAAATPGLWATHLGIVKHC